MSEREDPRPANREACPTCGLPLAPSVVTECSGSHSNARVYFLDLPVRACGDAAHPRRWVDPEFGTMLTDALFHSELSVARLSFRGQRCCNCRASLATTESHSAAVEGVLRLRGVPEFRVRIEAPGRTCLECGTEQIGAARPETLAISEAVRVAFESVAFEP